MLPHVDVFLPSIDKILFMLGEELPAGQRVQGQDLDRVSQTLLDMGSAIVVLKLGSGAVSSLHEFAEAAGRNGPRKH